MDELPHESIKVNVRVMVFSAGQLPGDSASKAVIFVTAASQLSLPVAVPKVRIPNGLVQSTVVSEGQNKMVGAVVSCTVIV